MFSRVIVYRGADDYLAYGGRDIYTSAVSVLGPSFSESRSVAESYNKKVTELILTPKKTKRYRSYNHLRTAIADFAISRGYSWGFEDRASVAKVFRNHLLSEGFDSISFPEGIKRDTTSGVSNTWICLDLSIIQKKEDKMEQNEQKKSAFNLKLHKEAQVCQKEKILNLKQQLEDARKNGDDKMAKLIINEIKKTIGRDMYDLIDGDHCDRGPIRQRKCKSPSFGFFESDDERDVFVPNRRHSWD